MWILLAVGVVGFGAQLIDGSIGMAFGVTSTSLLLTIGYGPAIASATVHLTEIGTTFVSGSFHLRFGNVDLRTLLPVALPGAVGAATGAYVLSSIDLTSARPLTYTLLLLLGLFILQRFSRAVVLKPARRPHPGWLVPLGLVGGFTDATGGGGWGPIVTTTLTASRALSPRKAIGTANAAEFAVAVAASAGFLVGLGSQSIPWEAVVALLVGGMLAAPIAAKLVSVVPQRWLGLLTGTVIVLLNTYQLGMVLGADTIIVVLSLLASAAVSAIFVTIGIRRRSRASDAPQEHDSEERID